MSRDCGWSLCHKRYTYISGYRLILQSERFQASTAMLMKSAFFWNITQRRVVILYHSALHNIAEERRCVTVCKLDTNRSPSRPHYLTHRNIRLTQALFINSVSTSQKTPHLNYKYQAVNAVNESNHHLFWESCEMYKYSLQEKIQSFLNLGLKQAVPNMAA
jgi:hypothetical protein